MKPRFREVDQLDQGEPCRVSDGRKAQPQQLLTDRPALNLSPEEQKLYKASFVEADKEQLGVLTGDKAVDFFAKSNLPTDVLGLIWQQADNENNGFLTEDGFNIALRLIGHAQAGTTVSPGLEKKRAYIYMLRMPTHVVFQPDLCPSLAHLNLIRQLRPFLK